MADAAYISVLSGESGAPGGVSARVYEVKRGAIAIAAATDTSLVAAVTGKVIRLLSLHLTVAGAQTFDFNDGTAYLFGSSSVEGVLSANGAAGGYQLNLPFTKYGHFETAAVSRALVLTTTTNVETAGYFTYCEV